MSEPDQVLSGHGAAEFLIDADAAGHDVFRHADTLIEGGNLETAGRHVSQVVEGQRRRSENDAGDPRAEHRLGVARLDLRVALRIADQEVVATLPGGALDMVRDRTPEWIRHRRDDQADAGVLTRFQLPGGDVGRVVELLDGLEDAALSFRAHLIVSPVEHIGDRARRNPRFFRDLVNTRHRFFRSRAAYLPCGAHTVTIYR